MAASRFKGASQAKVSESGIKLSDGKHLCEITRITFSDSGKNGDYYVVELKVIESDSANDASGRQIDPPGAERVWTQSMDKKSFPLPKLNAFVYAAAGYNHKNPDDAAVLAAKVTPEMDTILDTTLDESDPLGFVGRRVWATTKAGESKNVDAKTGKPYTFVQYTFAPDPTQGKLELF